MSRYVAAAALILAITLGGLLALLQHQNQATQWRLEAAEQALLEANTKALEASACDPTFVAVWPALDYDIAWGLPPKVNVKGKIEIKPFPDQAEAMAQIATAGPGVGRRLIEFRGQRSRDIPFTWIPKLGKP